MRAGIGSSFAEAGSAPDLNRRGARDDLPALARIGLEAEPSSDSSKEGQCQFEVYLEDQRKVTSTHTSGGMWRWRLCSSSGAVIAQSQEYRTDAACLDAIAALRNFAASARIVRQS